MRPLVLGALVCAAITAFQPRPAAADPSEVAWPTFFRTGPGAHFVVLQELSRGTAIEVRSCASGWCAVQVGRVTGYVSASDLAAPSPQPAAAEPDPAQCFDSSRAGYEGGEVFRYCPR